jgi:cold shock CspA family protein/uncharacterized LabA/DUF88 family protein
MKRCEVYVDGPWLQACMSLLAADRQAQKVRIDYGLLPGAITDELTRKSEDGPFEVAEARFYSTKAVNFDEQDAVLVERREKFLSTLEEKCHFTTCVLPVDFRGQRVRSRDRKGHEREAVSQPSVAAALTADMVYRAATEDGFDVAVLVAGSRDYLPALQRVREAGKKTVVASIWGSCAREYTEAEQDEAPTDFAAIWLDDLHSVVEKKDLPAPPARMPTSNEGVYTRRLEQPNGAFPDTSRRLSTRPPRRSNGGDCRGVVKRVLRNDGYGFIRRDDGKDYYFNLHSLGDVPWERVHEDLPVTFQVMREPTPDGKAGAAQQVRLTQGPG